MVYGANIAMVSFMGSVRYVIARRDGLFRNPPTDEEARLALVDQSVPDRCVPRLDPRRRARAGTAARYCWLSLLVIGPVSGRWTDRRRRQERRCSGSPRTPTTELTAPAVQGRGQGYWVTPFCPGATPPSWPGMMRRGGSSRSAMSR